MDNFIESLDLENAAVPVKQKRSGYILLEYPDSISHGPFCWISDEHKAAFWHERSSKENSIKRGVGYAPLNRPFPGSHAHHLYLENNSSFCVNIPGWLHLSYTHFKRKPDTLDTINAVAIDFLINEAVYSDLFEMKSYL